jgi:hypothetical protein
MHFTKNSGSQTMVSKSAMNLALLLTLAACGGNKPSTPVVQAAPVAITSSAPVVAPSAHVDPPAPRPARLPALYPERLVLGKSKPDSIYRVGNVLAVAEGPRVGKLTGDTVEWVGSVPASVSWAGPNEVSSVQGNWPDAIDVLYRNVNARAAMPTYYPLTGKGKAITFGEGGQMGWISNVVHTGDSTLLAGLVNTAAGYQITTVRGPVIKRALQTPAQAGCKTGEVTTDWMPAVYPDAIDATPAGTLISVGNFCEKRGIAAEIWGKDGKSRIVDLSWWRKDSDGLSRMVKGTGDELWVYSQKANSTIHYANGDFDKAPIAGHPPVSGAPVFGVYREGDTLQRLVDGKWQESARLAWWPKNTDLVSGEDGSLWGSTGEGVYRLKEGPSLDYEEGCTTPFVSLYEAASFNEKNYAYPETRKALSTLPGITTLVEFEAFGARWVGVPVTGKAQGEAVVAHVKANMKDEAPRLVCYAPKEARKLSVP